MRWVVVVVSIVALGTGCGGDEAVPDGAGPPPIDASLDDATLPPDAEPTDLVVGAPFGPLDDVPGPALDGPHAAVAWNGTDFVLLEDDHLGYLYDRFVRWIGLDGSFHGARHAFGDGDDLDDNVGEISCRADGTCAYSTTSNFGGPSRKLVLLPADDDGSNAQAPYVELPTEISNLPPIVGAHGNGYVAVGGTVGVERYQRITADGLLIDLTPVDIDVGVDCFVHEEIAPIFACDDDGCTLVMSTVSFLVEDDVRIMRFHANGDVDGPIVVPGVLEAEGFACAGATCLIAEHRAGSNQLRGLRVDRDGTPIGAAFTIATLVNGSRSVNVGADATGFVVTTGVGVTDTTPGRMHAIRVGLDGTVGADLDVMPTASHRYALALRRDRRDGIACGPTRCLLVATIDHARIVARLDGTTIVDDPPLAVTAASASYYINDVDAPGHALLAWQERRLVSGAAASSLRAARLGPAGWASVASVELPNDFPPALAWTGSGYLGVYIADGSVIRLDEAGSVIGTATPVTGARGIACRTRCLVALTSGGGVFLDADGSLVANSSFTGPRGTAMAFETTSTPGGFALVSTDDGLDVALVSATGEIVSTIDVAGELLVTPSSVRRVVVDSTLILTWESDGTTVARTLDSDLVLSPPVEIDLPLSQSSVAALGHAALFAWFDYITSTYRAVRLDTSLSLLEPPFDLAPGPFDAGSAPVATSSGTSVTVAFTYLDPLLDIRRLAVIPVRLQ